mmetsp:Transcript_24031/g.61927  ORF Transcript_24031/g.61927 Transcript_24031/m.61927 type:complete len:261 (-) Transcript_24031:895-1677(-)
MAASRVVRKACSASRSSRTHVFSAPTSVIIASRTRRVNWMEVMRRLSISELAVARRGSWLPIRPPRASRRAVMTLRKLLESRSASSYAVFPNESSMLTSAPVVSMRKLSAFTEHVEAARCMGARPSESCMLTEHLKASRRLRWVTSLVAAALLRCSATSKSPSSAPSASSSSHASSRRPRSASCSGVAPRRSRAFTFAPLLSSRRILSMRPSAAARWSAVRCSRLAAFTLPPYWHSRLSGFSPSDAAPCAHIWSATSREP